MCPRCHSPAIDCPPPDKLVVRWFPVDLVMNSMAAHRAAINPTWTWQKARYEADVLIGVGVVYRLCYTFAGQLGLPALKQSVCPPVKPESDLLHQMNLYALVRDEEAYRAAYHELVNIQPDALA